MAKKPANMAERIANAMAKVENAQVPAMPLAFYVGGCGGAG